MPIILFLRHDPGIMGRTQISNISRRQVAPVGDRTSKLVQNYPDFPSDTPDPRSAGGVHPREGCLEHAFRFWKYLGEAASLVLRGYIGKNGLEGLREPRSCGVFPQPHAGEEGPR